MTVPEFDDFYVALRPRLVRTAYAVAGDLGVAEDAVQTAFAKAFRSWRRISRLASPEAYVRKMAVNEVLTTRRRAHARREVVRAELPDSPAVGSTTRCGRPSCPSRRDSAPSSSSATTRTSANSRSPTCSAAAPGR